jgi:diguanylate cyclase (GGDEF)-like protein
METADVRPQTTGASTAYCLLVGLSALLILIFNVASSPRPGAAGLAETSLLILAASLSWRFGFLVTAETAISLDLSYMLMASILLPSPLPLLVGAGTGLLGGLLRRGTRRTGARDPARSAPTLLLSAGTALLTVACARAALLICFPRPAPGDGVTLELCLQATVAFAALVSANTILAALSVALRGGPVDLFLDDHIRRVVPLEMLNVPLSILMVVTRERSGLPAFLLLAGIALLASILLKGLDTAQDRLRRTNRELELRAMELAALNNIGRQISSSLDLRRVFGTIHRQVAGLIDAATFCVALLDDERSEVRRVYLVEAGIPREGGTCPMGRDPISWVIKSGCPLHMRHMSGAWISDDGNCDPGDEWSALRSILVVPLRRPEEGTLGALLVGSSRPQAFLPRHEEMLSSIADHAAIAIENARNYQGATIDQGTRLYFKDYFRRRLEEELRRARRYGLAFSVLMMDLDGFKRINDEFGHQAGDRFLRRVGDAITANLRGNDIASRYGGEEFAVLLPETDQAESVVIAERIRRHVSEIRLEEGRRRFGATVSIGIASYPHSARRGTDDLIRKADLALYQAKREGKDKVISAA